MTRGADQRDPDRHLRAYHGAGLVPEAGRKGGAGTLVPITGFANAVVSPAIEFKCEGYVPGVGAKMFLIAGPVIVYGLLASTVGRAVLLFAALYLKGE